MSNTSIPFLVTTEFLSSLFDETHFFNFQVKSSQSISSENGYSPSKKYVYITTLSKYTTSIKLVTVISEEAVLLITKLRIGRFSKSLWEGQPRRTTKKQHDELKVYVNLRRKSLSEKREEKKAHWRESGAEKGEGYIIYIRYIRYVTMT